MKFTLIIFHDDWKNLSTFSFDNLLIILGFAFFIQCAVSEIRHVFHFLKNAVLAFTLYHRFALFSFQGTIFFEYDFTYFHMLFWTGFSVQNGFYPTPTHMLIRKAEEKFVMDEKTSKWWR